VSIAFKFENASRILAEWKSYYYIQASKQAFDCRSRSVDVGMRRTSDILWQLDEGRLAERDGASGVWWLVCAGGWPNTLPQQQSTSSRRACSSISSFWRVVYAAVVSRGFRSRHPSVRPSVAAVAAPDRKIRTWRQKAAIWKNAPIGRSYVAPALNYNGLVPTSSWNGRTFAIVVRPWASPGFEVSRDEAEKKII